MSLRRPSSFTEDPAASTSAVLPAPPTAPAHGDKGSEKSRGIGQAFLNSTHQKKDAVKDNAPGRPRSTQTLLYTTPATDSPMQPPAKDITPDSMVEGHSKHRSRRRDPWAFSKYTLAAALAGFAVFFLMVHSFTTRQLDTKGCGMCYMHPGYTHFPDFDTEHTRFASKYSLHLYREGGSINDDPRVRLAYS